MTNSSPSPQGSHPFLSTRGPRRFALIAGAVAVALIGPGTAWAVVATADASPAPMASTTMTASSSGAAASAHSPGRAGRAKVNPARQAWAHRYGVDRATMPNLPDVAAATPAQRAAALDLLRRTEAETAQYADLATAKAAGYDLTAALTRAERRHPALAKAIRMMDAGSMPAGHRMPMLHVANKHNRRDGKVLDPSAPETLMYEYQGHGQWKLVGVMYTANESYPQAPPDPGGHITRWHYHDKSGGQALMMHLFFVPGDDLAQTYAAEMTS